MAKRGPKPGDPRAKAAGKKGGETTKARHGAEHYRKAGEKGGATCMELYGIGHFMWAGSLGGQATAARREEREDG